MFWTAIFTLAYTQSPLYTSNQNQYFLQGLAQAGLGNLREDWLANTIDPTPVFSWLVEGSWRLIPWQPIFYLYFGILAGIYLFSILGIAEQVWGRASLLRRWLFLSILVILHSSALRYVITQAFGVSWDYLLDGGVAHQRLLGTVLQPSTFGVLIVLSIYLVLRRNYIGAEALLLVSAYFHPTYLLSAGVLTAVYMGLLYQDRRDLRVVLALGVGALIGVIPILWHVSTTFGGTTPQWSAQAHEILVKIRIPHHALVASWLDASVLVKLLFVGMALVILGRGTQSIHNGSSWKPGTKLFHILLWPALLALSLTIIQIGSRNLQLALLFPWRLSTWLVPLSVSLTAGWLVFALGRRFELERFGRWVVAACLLIGIVFAAAGTYKFWVSWQAKHTADDRPMLAYVEANKQPGDVYLIPLKMQDFRLETGAAAYVDFKSIPYKDVEVLEWDRRVQVARGFYASERCAALARITAEGITHLVLPAGHPLGQCDTIEKKFQDPFWSVYNLQ